MNNINSKQKVSQIEVRSNAGCYPTQSKQMIPINTIGPPPKPKRGQQILLERDTVVIGNDYDMLTNLPSINNVELKGDISTDQLGISMESLGLSEIPDDDIINIAKSIFE